MKQEQPEEFGIIEFPNGAHSCKVQVRSETLAVLEVPSSADIPDDFDLCINRERFQCRVRWRDQQRIGVMFM